MWEVFTSVNISGSQFCYTVIAGKAKSIKVLFLFRFKTSKWFSIRNLILLLYRYIKLYYIILYHITLHYITSIIHENTYMQCTEKDLFIVLICLFIKSSYTLNKKHISNIHWFMQIFFIWINHIFTERLNLNKHVD